MWSPGPPAGSGLGGGLVTLSGKTLLLQKLEAQKIHFIKGNTVAGPHNRSGSMMHGGQSPPCFIGHWHAPKTSWRCETGMYVHCTKVAGSEINHR